MKKGLIVDRRKSSVSFVKRIQSIRNEQRAAVQLRAAEARAAAKLAARARALEQVLKKIVFALITIVVDN